MPDAVLELRQIGRTYRQGGGRAVPVLRAVDLCLSAGEVVALIAPSGAGKSTLLHIAGLLDRPDTGEVLIQAQPMAQANDTTRTRARREALGFVYQFHHLLPDFTAAENIILPQLANGIGAAAARRRALALLDRVGIGARADHRPDALSGGEQQRVALCRALANGPAVLLADEPTGNLDPATAETVFALMLETVRDNGLSALVATHNLDLAGRMDRVVRLEAGQIVTP